MKNKNNWIILGLCLIGVLILGSITIFGNISPIDEWFYNGIISLKSDFFTSYFRFMTLMAEPITLIILSSLALLTILLKKRGAIYLVGFLIISTMINRILKYIVARDRPEGINLIIETGYSFPSGHAMGATSFYGFIIFLVANSKLSKKLKWFINTILVFLIINICLSRVYLGVHFITDVFCGALISVCILIIGIHFLKKCGRDVF